MNIKKDAWVLEKAVTTRQAETLFILLSAAEFPIQQEMRSHEYVMKYPCLAWDGKDGTVIYGCGYPTSEHHINFSYHNLPKISYEALMDALKELISNQIKQQI